MNRRVVVVGGGLSGLTAALRCADAGAQVTLLEARPRLGGLTHSFRRGELSIDNGQHVFLRCCTSYRQLLTRLGVADQVVLQDRLDVGVRSPTTRGRLCRTRLPAPLHLGAALLRYAVLRPSDRLRAARGALALRSVNPGDPAVDDQSFGAWLTEHGQNEQTIAALFDLVGVATLNARAAHASLALAATVMQQGLLRQNAAGDIGWSRVPLQQLHGDAGARCLRAAGAHVRTGAKVTGLSGDRGGWVLHCDSGSGVEQLAAEAVVLAVPPLATAALAPAGSVDAPEGWAQQLGASPIVNVHVIFDRPVLEEDFFAGLGGPVQWVFDRTRTAGLRSGQYLAVSLSAADDIIDLTTAQIRVLILPALFALVPAARHAVVRDFFVTRSRTATFSPAPGTAALRPPNATRAPGLVLAGAHTDTGWPATMEGAVRSGDTAADVLLSNLDAPQPEGARAA